MSLGHTRPFSSCSYVHIHTSQIHLCATQTTEIPFAFYQRSLYFKPLSSVNILSTELSALSRTADFSDSFDCSIVLHGAACECAC